MHVAVGLIVRKSAKLTAYQHWDASQWRRSFLRGHVERAWHTYAQIHQARADDPIFHKTTWRRANPSLEHMPNLMRAYEKDAARAKISPQHLQSFRALRLNQGVEQYPEAATHRSRDVDEVCRESPTVFQRRRGPSKFRVFRSRQQDMRCPLAPRIGLSHGALVEVVAAFPRLSRILAERGQVVMGWQTEYIRMFQAWRVGLAWRSTLLIFGLFLHECTDARYGSTRANQCVTGGVKVRT